MIESNITICKTPFSKLPKEFKEQLGTYNYKNGNITLFKRITFHGFDCLLDVLNHEYLHHVLNCHFGHVITAQYDNIHKPKDYDYSELIE